MMFCRCLPVCGVFALLFVAPGLARAQNAAPALPAVVAVSPLTITPPPGATVTLEVDGRDSDLLGMVKDMIASVTKSVTAAPTNGAAKVNGKAVTTALPPALYGFLNEQGTDVFVNIFKDLHHLHLVSYKKPVADLAGSAPVPLDALAFHEPSLRNEGGRRLVYSAQGTHVLIMGFDTPHGMAVVVDDGRNVTVARTEGDINVKALTAALMVFGSMRQAEDAPPAKPMPKKSAPVRATLHR